MLLYGDSSTSFTCVTIKDFYQKLSLFVMIFSCLKIFHLFHLLQISLSHHVGCNRSPLRFITIYDLTKQKPVQDLRVKTALKVAKK